MTHNISMRVDQAGTADSDFAALADQLIQDSWHLPPEGDQSWREQDAQRIFSGHGKDDINEEPPAVEDGDTPGDESDARDEPSSMPLRPAGILLSLALATGLMFVVVIVSAPQILTAGFGRAPVAAENLRPSLADSGPVALPPTFEADKAATSNGNLPIAHAPVKATVAETVPKHPASVRLATAKAPRAKPGRVRPIGEAYFASHTPAVPARKTASANWKAEVARWDEKANEIRARRENAKTD
jgi:hypothetical protein